MVGQRQVEAKVEVRRWKHNIGKALARDTRISNSRKGVSVLGRKDIQNKFMETGCCCGVSYMMDRPRDKADTKIKGAGKGKVS